MVTLTRHGEWHTAGQQACNGVYLFGTSMPPSVEPGSDLQCICITQVLSWQLALGTYGKDQRYQYLLPAAVNMLSNMISHSSVTSNSNMQGLPAQHLLVLDWGQV